VGGGFRSLYGSTKLASELFVEEYAANFGLSAVINRCGVIAGAGQFGKTDQGVFTLWVARHLFGGNLRYFGWGGKGMQVRDLLHPSDLFCLLKMEIENADKQHGEVYGVGGGIEGSVSLLEYTKLCEETTGKKLNITGQEETADVDVPYFVTDYSKTNQRFDWKPVQRPRDIVKDIAKWLRNDEEKLRALFA